MLLTFEGKTYEGFAVLPERKEYKLHVIARGNLDMFTLSSCHRDWPKEKGWNVKKKVGHWFWERKIDKKREVKFTYKPNRIEKRRKSCMVKLAGYEAKKGRHSRFMLDFENQKKLALKFYLDCNGYSSWKNGVGLCESRAGQIQMIQFSEKVVVFHKPECALDKKESKFFNITLKKGKCVYTFKTLSKPRKEARLTVSGYTGITIREL